MPRVRKTFKYRGTTYRSNYELAQAKRLVDEGIKFLYEEEQIAYNETVVNGHCPQCGNSDVHKLRNYTPDFYIVETDVYVETKGKLDQAARRKMKAVCTQSDKDIRLVLMRDNWLTRKHSMKYSRWCELNGIQYAIGDIPLEWCKK